MNTLYKKYFYSIAISPFSCILLFLMNFVLAINFFIVKNFFSMLSTTDLNLFFSSFSLSVCLFLPALVSLLPCKKNYILKENVSDFKNVLIRNFVILTFLFFFLALSFLILFGISVFGNLSFSEIFCGYFGLIFFLILSCVFVNYIFLQFENKALSFLISYSGIFVFNYIHLLPSVIQNFPFSKVTNYFSFAWQFDSFSKGLLSIQSILFFIISIVSFYILSVNVFLKSRDFKNKNFKLLKGVSLFTFILLFLLNSKINCSFDTTKNKVYSVSKYSKELLSKTDETLSVTYYLSPKLKTYYPQVKNICDYLERFCSFSNNVYLSVKNPDDEEKNRLYAYGVYGEELNPYSDKNTSGEKVYSCIVLNYKGKNRIIPFILRLELLEFELDSNLSLLVNNSVRKVCVLSGLDYSFDDELSYVIPYLESQGFSVEVRTLPFTYNDTEVPLFVCGTQNFSRSDCIRFENFILEGGKAFVAAQPYTVALEGNWSVEEKKNYFARSLNTFGMYFNEGLVCDLQNFTLSMYNDSDSTGKSVAPNTEKVAYPFWPVISSKTNTENKNIVNGLTLFWPSSLTLDNEVSLMEGFTVKADLYTSNESWRNKKIEGVYNTNPFTCEKNNSGYSKQLISCRLEKNNELRLYLYCNQYAFTKTLVSFSSSQASLDLRSFSFLEDILLELNNECELVSVKNKNKFDTSLYKVDSGEFYSKAKSVLLLCILIPLLFYVVLYLVFYLKRKIFIRKKINA